MHFKNGDLAIIVAGPWAEAIGCVVKIIWKCRAYSGKGVGADGLCYWMTADGPIYLVRPISARTLPAGTQGAGGVGSKVLHRLKRRPYCGCHMRPLVRVDVEAISESVAETQQKTKKLHDVLTCTP